MKTTTKNLSTFEDLIFIKNVIDPTNQRIFHSTPGSEPGLPQSQH